LLQLLPKPQTKLAPAASNPGYARNIPIPHNVYCPAVTNHLLLKHEKRKKPAHWVVPHLLVSLLQLLLQLLWLQPCLPAPAQQAGRLDL
jgi:hypothetical protein